MSTSDVCLECGTDLTCYRMKMDYRLKTEFCDMECKAIYLRRTEVDFGDRWNKVGLNSSMDAMREIAGLKPMLFSDLYFF